MGDRSVSRPPLPAQVGTTEKKHRYTPILPKGFEPTIPVLERPKAIHVLHSADIGKLFINKSDLLLSLAPQPSLGLDFLHKIQLNFLEASKQFSFLQGRIIPTPNPHPGGPGLCIYIPER
jgi:hypothetical protein